MNYRTALFLLTAIVGLAFALAETTADTSPPPTRLLPETPIERTLSPTETHVYEAILTPDRPWLIHVEQQGIDVVVSAHGPGCSPCSVNAPTYRWGPETLLLQPETEDTWQVEVSSQDLGVGPGHYALSLVALGEPSAANPPRRRALQAATEAGEASLDETRESRTLALEQYREAKGHWEALGDEHRVAWASLASAILHDLLGDAEETIKGLKDAAALFRKVGEGHGEAIALADLGLTLLYKGEPHLARDYLDQAVALQLDLGNLAGQALSQNNLCLVTHRTGGLNEAKDCYEGALELVRRAEEQRTEALVLTNLGEVYERLGEPELAISAYEQAITIRRSIGDRKKESHTLNNLGVCYRKLGEHQEALTHYTAGLEITRELGDVRWEGRLLSNLGAAYLNLGELERARFYLEQALPIRRKTKERVGEAATLNNLGRLQSKLGHFDQATVHHREALVAATRGSAQPTQAISLRLLGQSSLASGKPKEALDFFAQALQIHTESDDRRGQADALHWTGEAKMRQGHYDKALVQLKEALKHRRAIRDKPGIAQSLGAMAQAEAEQGEIRAARQHVREALEEIEALRTRIADPDLRAAFASSQHRAYELEVELLMRSSKSSDGGRDPAAIREALEASERARARTLVDLLQDAGARLEHGVEPALLEQRQALQRRLDAKALRQVQLLSHGQDEEAARREYLEILTQLEAVEKDLYPESPSYEALVRPSHLNSAAIQDLLDSQTLLLEYFLGEHRSFLWAVTAESIVSFDLPPRHAIEDLCRQAYEALNTRDYRALAKDNEILAQLSRAVLGPVADQLSGQRLVVVADGALHYIPFVALPTPRIAEEILAGKALRRPRRLLQDHEIVHLPSASTLAIQRRTYDRRAPLPNRVAILADPVFDERDIRVRQRTSASPLASVSPSTTDEEGTLRGDAALKAITLGLGRLKASSREAKAIAGLLPSRDTLLALDFAADRDLALSGELRDYRIVHFATHGLIDARRPELSSLVLSMVDRQGKLQDGFLRLRDLYGLDLRGDLVVLSGCRTALGQEIRGEGLVGLTRGFMYAGVPRVVASLWQVEDRVTADLMEHFYQAMLKDRQTVARALRQAQLAIAEDSKRSDPYFWAAFVLQGDWR